MFTYGFEQEQTYRVFPFLPQSCCILGQLSVPLSTRVQRASPVTYNGHGIPVLQCTRVTYCPRRTVFETQVMHKAYNVPVPLCPKPLAELNGPTVCQSHCVPSALYPGPVVSQTPRVRPVPLVWDTT